MAEPAEVRAARARVRERERAVWNDVERVGRDARARDGARQTVTQAEADVAKGRPKEGVGA